MTKKHLILLSDNYPNSNGEFFLDDEINVISNQFQKITVLCSSQKKDAKRTIPINVNVIKLPQIRLLKRFFFTIQGLFFLPLWQELFSLKKTYGLKPNILLLKILLIDYVRSTEVIHVLKINGLTNPIEHVLYSYWHDYKALAIARLANHKGMKTIARGHGWDLDYKRHSPQYLPYKNFIVENLDLSISISDFGKSMLQKTTNSILHRKICVSKLGKLNHRMPRLEKQDYKPILICSCSSLIPLKRVDLIVHFCSLLGVENLKWIHFGSGKQMEELKLLANELNLNAEFKGDTINQEILDFYHNNYVDLFINFSIFEGIPVSIMEAQSAGIPVLATAVGGTPEIVNDTNGFLVDKDFDMKFTADCILSFLQNSPANIREKRESAYLNWKMYYNAEKNYAEFADILLRGCKI
jgi:glycosyltransferase involved in cell wall biosynthesis